MSTLLGIDVAVVDVSHIDLAVIDVATVNAARIDVADVDVAPSTWGLPTWLLGVKVAHVILPPALRRLTSLSHLLLVLLFLCPFNLGVCGRC